MGQVRLSQLGSGRRPHGTGRQLSPSVAATAGTSPLSHQTIRVHAVPG
jgi:hypothetical protein